MNRISIFSCAAVSALTVCGGFLSASESAGSSKSASVPVPAAAQASVSASSETFAQKISESAARGIAYLRTVQAEDGSFQSQMGTGLTSIAVIGWMIRCSPKRSIT